MKDFDKLLALILVVVVSWQVQAQCPQPTVTGNQILCANSTLTLTAQGSYASYAWSNGDNTPSTVISTPSVYTVTVTCTNGSTAIGGASVLGFTTGIGIVNPIICAGQCAQANILVTNGQNTGPFTAVLSLSTGGTQTIVSPSGQGNFFTVLLCPTQTTTYTIVSVTNSQGCTAFINPNIASGTITVNGGSVSINGPTSLCPGQTATLSANPTNFQSYTWSNGGSGSTTTISSTGTYSVTATATGGCTATASITVDPVPFDPPTITGGGPLLCPGNSLELTVGGSYASYAWSNGESGQSITVATSGNYTVTVTNANGCTGTDSEAVNTGAPANPSINGPNSICPNATATLTTIGNFASYQWSSGETTSSINVATAGSYTVTVTNSDGCTGTAIQVLSSVPLPSVSFAGPPEVCAGECLTFNVTFTGTPPFSLTYTAGSGGQQTQTFTTNTGTLEICPPVGTAPGTATLSAVSLTDANCECD